MDTQTGISLKSSAIAAGISLLLMAVIAPIANFSILNGLIAPGDAAKTLDAVAENMVAFRIAIALFLTVAILDVIVAWALYIFLKPTHKSLSLLAAWMRLAYASVLIVLLVKLVDVSLLLNGDVDAWGRAEGHLQAQVMLSVNSFLHGWEFSLIVFGFHLLLLGWLILKAGYMRHILGVLVLLAGFGYVVDGFGKLLSDSYPVSVSMFTFIGEVVLIFWLLIAGQKKQAVRSSKTEVL